MRVPATEPDSDEWAGRTVEYHRARIREHLGFRTYTVADAEKPTAYPAEHVAHKERGSEQVRMKLPARCRAQSVEPPCRAGVTGS